MSLKKVHLRKLLELFYSAENKRKTLLRTDIRNEIKRARGEVGDGGDFYGPFWTDAKHHVAGLVDLHAETKARIASNRRRQRLYPLLTNGFLSWWNEKRRWRNEVFEFIPESVNAHLPIPEIGGIVKVENLLALKIGDQFNRIIYPYFSEVPTLPEEGGRIGIWLLNEALTNYRQEDLRMLDVLRSASFGTVDYPLKGNERDLFLRRYKDVLSEWKKLRKDYP